MGEEPKTTTASAPLDPDPDTIKMFVGQVGRLRLVVLRFYVFRVWCR